MNHQGPPLAFEASSEPLPCPCVFDPIAVAVCLGCYLWDLVSPHWGVLRSLRTMWVGHLAPSAMTDEEGLATWS